MTDAEKIAELEDQLLKTENLLYRFLNFKRYLFRTGAGDGTYLYYGPVADTEAYFRDKHA
jgi:hypothetical protein